MSWIEDPGIADFRGFNISQLGLDQAWINVTSLVEGTALWVYELSSDCHKVSYFMSTPQIGTCHDLFSLFFAVPLRKEDSTEFQRAL